MTEHHLFHLKMLQYIDARVSQRTQIGQTAGLDHVIFTPICLFYISTRRSSRRHNVADLEAALICIALKMGQ